VEQPVPEVLLPPVPEVLPEIVEAPIEEPTEAPKASSTPTPSPTPSAAATTRPPASAEASPEAVALERTETRKGPNFPLLALLSVVIIGCIAGLVKVIGLPRKATGLSTWRH
jgi:hypothetical protein